MIAEVSLDADDVRIVFSSLPEEAPVHLKRCDALNVRSFRPKIEEHAKFDKQNDWFVGLKTSKQPCTCSGCLRKGVI